MSIEYNIELLLQYALHKELISKWDIIPTRNALMDLLKVKEPFEGIVNDTPSDEAVSILERILDYCYQNGLIEDNTTTYRDLMDAKIMSLLLPRQSEIVHTFFEKGRIDKQDATNYFYNLSKNSNYIRMDRIKKNLYWKSETEFGDLEITINLSKPEKDPKEIEKAKLLPQSSYPKCLLCVENVGFAGGLNHPARQNHRVIPLTVNDEQWYLQYSPYVYYNEHSIVFNAKHVPMKISIDTFKRLLSFIEEIPHYFLGSNADLPIVGGSILSHDHFQGGYHTFPMEVATIKDNYISDEFNDVKIGIVNWQMSVIRLSSNNKQQLILLSDKILNKWKAYSDEKSDIIAHTEKDGEKTPHNTITPIARKNKDKLFEIDLVLRNNRRTKEHPDGLFHPHSHLHNIKKENIGLIEVMGLAVLPGRLKNELEIIKHILTGETKLELLSAEENNAILVHHSWIKELVKIYGIKNNDIMAEEILKKEVASKFSQVLECAGVYKNDSAGMEGFRRFMEYVGFKQL